LHQRGKLQKLPELLSVRLLWGEVGLKAAGFPKKNESQDAKFE
jgi:hypothetical protein